MSPIPLAERDHSAGVTIRHPADSHEALRDERPVLQRRGEDAVLMRKNQRGRELGGAVGCVGSDDPYNFVRLNWKWKEEWLDLHI